MGKEVVYGSHRHPYRYQKGGCSASRFRQPCELFGCGLLNTQQMLYYLPSLHLKSRIFTKYISVKHIKIMSRLSSMVVVGQWLKLNCGDFWSPGQKLEWGIRLSFFSYQKVFNSLVFYKIQFFIDFFHFPLFFPVFNCIYYAFSDQNSPQV